MRRFAFWTLFAVTMALYGTILFWSLPHIAAEAGGLVPFDARPFGYSFADVQTFLAALSPEGVAFYHYPQHLLDLFYPPLMSLMLFFAIAALLPRRLGYWRWALALIAWPSAIFDLLENAGVDRMLDAGPAAVTQPLVATANLWTTLKADLTSVAMLILLLLLIWRACATLIGRRRAA